jgi:DNA-binding transcriptional LysR family regulator
MNIELRHLRYFIAVAEELHFGRAAQRLHISQPPLSMQIQALEQAVGTQLLSRTQRKVELTEAGRYFLAESQQILARLDAASSDARRVQRGELGQLVVGFVTVADYNVLPLVLREFRDRHPAIRLTLKEATTDAQIIDLLSGRIDVGLLLPPIAEDALQTEEVLSEPLLAALPTRHPLAQRRGPIRLSALALSPFIMFPRIMAPGLYDAIVAFCRSAGFSPRIEQEAVQMQTIISLVSAELGVALIPASLENLRRTGVIYKPLRETSPQVQTALAWRKSDTLPALDLFLDVARRVARDAVATPRGTAQQQARVHA